ncbi:MAG: response regulator [Deltaproteobacteria bacterium]|nr:response regulator [Deltaproteobacteria bacterium]
MRAPKNKRVVVTRILLLEDNLEHAQLIEETLLEGLHGISVKVVSSLAAALKEISAASRPYDLILTDYLLANSSGTTLVKRIKKEIPEIPLIVITGRGNERIAAEVIKLGAEDYVVKSRDSLKALPRIIQRTLVKRKRSNMEELKSLVFKIIRLSRENKKAPQITRLLTQLKKLTQIWSRST